MPEFYYRIRYMGAEFIRNILRHQLWLVFLLSWIVFQLGLNIQYGYWKSHSDLDWIDIVGEGGAAFFVITWLLILLSVRPSGRVTTFLTAGLIGVFASCFQDLLDELIELPENVYWDSLIESIPLGLVILTYGIWLWSREQKVINRYFDRRELRCRDHRPLDHMTSLSKPSYLKQQLDRLRKHQARSRVALIQLDIRNAEGLSHQLGHAVADRFLADLSEVLRVAIRQNDLLCHSVGYRFYLLLTDVSPEMADQMVEDLDRLIRYFPFRSGNHQAAVYLTPVFGIAYGNEVIESGEEEDKLPWSERMMAMAKQGRWNPNDTADSSAVGVETTGSDLTSGAPSGNLV
ncbi:hypothetical protein BTA51_14935 [Hahella sp. CCB-MM4]|nr:hypothetical protein BTA51_14935 [Hahella sp. CCB-MM4]